MHLVRFRAILRLEPFLRAGLCSSICRCSQEHSFLNFSGRSLPVLFIWCNDATGAISSNSETTTSFPCMLVLVNFKLRREPSVLNFRPRSLQILFILLNDATGAISCYSETQTFFARMFALVQLPLLSRGLLCEFSCVIASNFLYLA